MPEESTDFIRLSLAHQTSENGIIKAAITPLDLTPPTDRDRVPLPYVHVHDANMLDVSIKC